MRRAHHFHRLREVGTLRFAHHTKRTSRLSRSKDVDGRDKPGHDDLT
jgi:hypothetical protein